MSDGIIKGTVEQVSCKEGNKHPKYGRSWRVGVKIDGEWYNGFFKKDADDLGLAEGVLVTFEAAENNGYMNIDPKSLKVSEATERKPASSGKAGSTGTSSAAAPRAAFNEAGVKVGHAINNAVQLAVAAGKTTLKDIHGFAVDILTLSVRLESQYGQIVEAAKKKFAEKPAPQQEPEQTGGDDAGDQQDEPPPPKKDKPAATGKGKAAASKPAPKPAPQQQADAFEDDDIPF